MEREYVIYKIECKTALEDGYVYVGSTSAYRKRKCQHKKACCSESPLKVYNLIRENGGWDNWEMNPIEELKATKTQARIREQYWIDHYKAVLNAVNAVKHPQYQQEFNKQYYELHKEEHNKRMLEYYYKNKEETKATRNKRAKEYRELHRDELNKKQNEKYHQKKNEKINV